MPRYLVERNFPDGLAIPANADGATAIRKVVDVNADEGVTWVHSYVNQEKTKTFCVYDGADPDAIKSVAERNGLPIDTITEVSVLEPYFYF